MRPVRSPQWGLLLVAIVLMATILASIKPHANHAPVAQAAGPDVYIRDTETDTGDETIINTGDMWKSPDIWVRTNPDPNYSPLPFNIPSWTPEPHEDAEYRDPKDSKPNYVYARVTNRGDQPSNGTERLRVYWTKASAGLRWNDHWNDYQPCGKTTIYGGEITKPRKNAATASVEERAAYVEAIRKIATMPEFTFSDTVQYWTKQNAIHSTGMSYAHTNDRFLPWHREMLNRYEALLQEEDPTVKLLYWDWMTDPTHSTNGFNFFTPLFMGASSGSIGAPFLPGINGPVTRALGNNSMYQLDLNTLATGHYMLRAKVFDNQGESSLSAMIMLEVQTADDLRVFLPYLRK